VGVEPTCHFIDAGLANLWLTIRRILPGECLSISNFCKMLYDYNMADVDKIIKDTNEEKTLFEWEAPERSFKKRDKDFWITAIAILVLFSVVLVFIKEFFLVVALVSVLFLYYVLSTVPPRMVKNKITNRGIKFEDTNYDWRILLRFWFKKSLNSELLEFETNLR
jgi:predicted histidine transporter YuiF (NhaC family)